MDQCNSGNAYPETLYKYYSQSGLEKTLSTNTFKWALPCEENDPFEALASGWDKVTIRNEVKDATKQDEAFLDAIFRSCQLQKTISHIAAYVSFSELNDSILMWSHYAEGHAGACIEVDVAKLRTLADNFSPVAYAEEDEAERKRIPVVKDDAYDESQDAIRDFLAFKAKAWEYEKEWRLIIPPMADCIEAYSGGNILVSKIPTGAIKCLTFGYNMPIPKRLTMAKLVRKNHPKCQFAEAMPDRKQYKLIINPLEIDTEFQTEKKPSPIVQCV